MDEEARIRRMQQLKWRLRKIERQPMGSKEFDWVQYYDVTDELGELDAQSPVMRGVLERVLAKRKARREKESMTDHETELLRKTWGDPADPSGLTITARFLEDGSLCFSSLDWGKGMRDFSGKDALETTLTIQAHSVPAFMLAFMATAFDTKRAFNLERIKKICRLHDIEFHYADF